MTNTIAEIEAHIRQIKLNREETEDLNMALMLDEVIETAEQYLAKLKKGELAP